MYFHLIILAVYTVFLACLTTNAMYLGHREDGGEYSGGSLGNQNSSSQPGYVSPTSLFFLLLIP